MTSHQIIDIIGICILSGFAAFFINMFAFTVQHGKNWVCPENVFTALRTNYISGKLWQFARNERLSKEGALTIRCLTLIFSVPLLLINLITLIYHLIRGVVFGSVNIAWVVGTELISKHGTAKPEDFDAWKKTVEDFIENVDNHIKKE